MELTYTQVGEYLLPNLTLGDDSKRQIGKYGRMRLRYLREHHPVIYGKMMIDGMLWRHLEETELACDERLAVIIQAMAKKEGVTGELKSSNQMEWVGRMNNIHDRAEEIILSELVYT